jgi:lipid-A-disaccharide synthase
MKYYIVAGEASGDLHASNLMRGIKASDPQAEFRFFGGDLMAAQGGTLTKHYRDMAFMGFVEVLMNLKSISANMNLCKADILDFKPDAVILVDYPGFNLRIAQFAKEQGFKVFYYIAPKVWAWKEGRVKKLKQYVDKLFIISPLRYLTLKSME